MVIAHYNIFVILLFCKITRVVGLDEIQYHSCIASYCNCDMHCVIFIKNKDRPV